MLVHVKLTVGLFLLHALIQGTVLTDKLYFYYTASENSLDIEDQLKEERERRIMEKVFHGSGLEVWFTILCPSSLV